MKTLRNGTLLLTLALASTATSAAQPHSGQAERLPNILFIVSDDIKTWRDERRVKYRAFKGLRALWASQKSSEITPNCPSLGCSWCNLHQPCDEVRSSSIEDSPRWITRRADRMHEANLQLSRFDCVRGVNSSDDVNQIVRCVCGPRVPRLAAYGRQVAYSGGWKPASFGSDLNGRKTCSPSNSRRSVYAHSRKPTAISHGTGSLFKRKDASLENRVESAWHHQT